MSNPFADKIPKIGALPFPEEGQQLTIGGIPKYVEVIGTVETIGGQKIMIKVSPIKYTILGNVPSKSNCYRIVTFKSKDPKNQGYSTLAKTKELKQYETDFAKQWINKGMISMDFNFEMDVYYPSKRADLDNSLKCVLDCLQHVGAIANDNLCQQIIVRRHIDKANPRIEFVITPTNP